MSTQSQLNTLQSEVTELTEKELKRLRAIEARNAELEQRLIDEWDFARCWHCKRLDHVDVMRRAGHNGDGEFFCEATECESERLDRTFDPYAVKEEDGMTLAKELRERDL